MRKILWLVIGVGVIVVIAFAALVWHTNHAAMVRDKQVHAMLHPVLSRLSDSTSVPTEEIAGLARNPLTRNRLYDALSELGQRDLFPSAYLNGPAFAESELSYWLAHGHELGQPPDEIELADTFIRSLPNGTSVVYYVFRFRVNPPHWAAADGWMAGIAGPYPQGEPPVTMVAGTFSSFEPFDARPASEHLDANLKATGSLLVR